MGGQPPDGIEQPLAARRRAAGSAVARAAGTLSSLSPAARSASVSARPPGGVHGLAPRDLEQPPAEARAVAQRGQLEVALHEDLLHDVLRRVDVPHDRQHGREQGRS